MANNITYNSPGELDIVMNCDFTPNVYFGFVGFTTFSPRETSYSTGDGVIKRFISFGRLCNETAGANSFPLFPNPETSYCAGPGPTESSFTLCFIPNVNAGAACLFDSGILLPKM